MSSRKRNSSPSGSSTSSRNSTSSTSSQFMVPWESKIGNEARNVPLPLPPKRYTISEMLRQESDLEQRIVSDIRASFGGSVESGGVTTKHFLVVHFGNYYTNYLGSHPAEFAIADFSIRDGLNSCFSKMLDPGSIPFGFRADFRAAAKEKGYDLPGYNPDIEFGPDCLDIIEDMMHKYPSINGEPGILYTTRTEMETVKQCLEFAAEKSGRIFHCKIYPLSRLIELLLIEGAKVQIPDDADAGAFRTYAEEDAIALINRGEFEYMVEMACAYHADESRTATISFCSMNIVKRWIYNSMGLLVRMFGCELYPHNHFPCCENSDFYRVEREIDDLPWMQQDTKSVSSDDDNESVSSGDSVRSLASFPLMGSEPGSGDSDLSFESLSLNEIETEYSDHSYGSFQRIGSDHGDSEKLFATSSPIGGRDSLYFRSPFSSGSSSGSDSDDFPSSNSRSFSSSSGSESEDSESSAEFSPYTGNESEESEGNNSDSDSSEPTSPTTTVSSGGMSDFSTSGSSGNSTSSISTLGSNYPSTSLKKELTPAQVASMNQAVKILEEGVLPHTRFVESNTTFWETANKDNRNRRRK